MEIENSVFVVTGGGRGLGLGMALDLARHGARLALIDVNQQALDDAVSQCAAAGADTRAYVADITNESVVEQTFAQIQSDFGEINGLINNAGLLRDGLLIKMKDGELVGKMPLSHWQAVIDVNLTGTFLCGREAAAIMAQQGKGGVIINISSISRAGNMGQSNYTATKTGVANMAVVWAKELARYGIRTAAIAPGLVNTEMTAQMKPEAKDRLLQMVPLKRAGEIEELAHSARYIIENDYFTGRVIEWDGGMRI